MHELTFLQLTLQFRYILRLKKSVFQLLETLSNERMLSNITPGFLADDEEFKSCHQVLDSVNSELPVLTECYYLLNP